MNEQYKKKTKLKKWLTHPKVFIFLVFLIVLVIVFTIFRIVLANKVKAELDKIHAQGLPVTLEELNAWYPEPPAGQNAADVYYQAFDQCMLDEENSKELPFFNGKGLSWPIGEPMSPETKKTLQEQLEINQETLELLYEAAEMPHCRYAVDFTKAFQGPFPILTTNGWMSKKQSPYFTKLWNAQQLLWAESLVAAEEDKPQEAARAARTAFKVGESLRTMPLIEIQAYHMAFHVFNILYLQHVLSRTTLPDSELERIDNLLKTPVIGDTFWRATVAQRCIGSSVFTNREAGQGLAELINAANRSARKSPTSPSGIPGIPLIKPAFPPPFSFRFRCLGLLDLEHLYFLERMKGYVEESRLVEKDPSVSRHLEPTIGTEYEKPPALYSFNNWFFYSWPTYSNNIETSIAITELGRLALAIERFHNHHKILPEKIQDLVPDYLDSVPNDPYDGKPVRYKKLPKGYLVYYVGLDKEDNGGECNPGDNSPDIVFHVER